MPATCILAAAFQARVRTADKAAVVDPGMTVVMSGFTGSGHPKAAFMRYVHTENGPVRDVAEWAASRHRAIAGVSRFPEAIA